MIQQLMSHSKAAIAYLGDAAHRRFVATIVALAVTHFIGRAFDADSVALTLEIIVGGVAGAWTKVGDQQ